MRKAQKGVISQFGAPVLEPELQASVSVQRLVAVHPALPLGELYCELHPGFWLPCEAQGSGPI